MRIPSDELSRIRRLYESGFYLQAYRRVEPYGPLRDWEGTASQVLAGRLAQQLGAPRLAHAIFLRAWRAARDDPEARYFASIAIAEVRGPLEAWQFQRDYRPQDDVSDDVRASLLAFRARLLATFRDFGAAEDAMAQALECAPGLPWLHVVRSFVFAAQDRHAAALDASRKAIALRPGYPQGVFGAAQSLVAMGNDEDALRLLSESGRESESAFVHWFLASLQAEVDDHAGALVSLDRVEQLSPLLEKAPARALAAHRSDAHYGCGDLEAAIRFAKLVEAPFFDAIADRLETASDDAGRVLLPVGFVKQHHRTCAPATLTAISRFWSRAVEQIEIAEEICYDGTPTHSERVWAESNGWTTREFTVTWDSAVALLDRGVPFSLTTSGPTEGHAQAVIGYDARRGTFLVRDPSSRGVIEMLGHELLDAARATGPRGMVMVPIERSSLLDGLELPDADLWDRAHAVQLALESHDRPQAHRLYKEMSMRDVDHLLTMYVRRALAAYDADSVGLLDFADVMLERFPDDPRHQLGKLACLNALGRENESLEFLEEICGLEKCHPVLSRSLAGELLKDARLHGNARRILRRILRKGFLEGQSLRILGELEWQSERFDRALELYRFAATFDDKNEQLSLDYFQASSHLGQIEAARRFLQTRADRYGPRSPGPLITLALGFRRMHQPAKYVATLEDSLKAHAHDANLLLYAARAFDELGRLDRAEELLAQAQTAAKRVDWLRASAELANRRGELERSLGTWNQVLEIDPLNLEGNAKVTNLLVSLKGPRAAREQLDTVCARFPENIALQKLRVEWMLNLDRSVAEEALRGLIDVSYVNAWARLRLALLLGERGEFREAFAEAEIASLLDPSDPRSAFVRGQLLKMDGRIAEAEAEFREAVRRFVGNDPPIHEMFAVCRSDDAQRDALAYLGQEILRQPSAGDAPMIYWSHGQHLLDPDELLDSLETMREARPDHPAAWSATIQQLLVMNRFDKARLLTGRFLECFPFDVRVYYDVARLRERMGDTRQRKLALEQVLSLDPDFGAASRELAELAQQENRSDEARRLLEEAVATAPLDALNHGHLAEVLWKSEERQAAVSRLEQALLLDLDYGWAWDSLRKWSAELDQPERPIEFARALTARRPGETRAWLTLAGALGGEQRVEEQLAAVDKALVLDPRCIDAHDRRVGILAESGRYREALEACEPEEWSGEPPLPLKGRAAWVRAVEGDLPGAIDRMESILEADPEYIWGWQQLASWYRESNAMDRYLGVAKTLVRLDPQNAIHQATLGDARVLNEDADGGKAAYSRAFELMPGHPFPGLRLFDLQLRTMEYEGAKRTLDRLRPNIDDAVALALQVRWDAANMKYAETFRGLGALLACGDANEEELWNAANAAYARWPVAVNQWLRDSLVRPETHPLAGEFWIRSAVKDGHWHACRKQLEAMDPGREITHRAATAFLECLCQPGQRRRLRSFVRGHRHLLRADAKVWGTTIWALFQLKDWRTAARWGGDWRERQGLEPWMLLNLAMCYRSRDQFEEAYQIHLRAQTLPPDGTSPRHSLWLAVEEAIRGETGAAETWLSKVPENSNEASDRFLAKLARLVLTAADEKAKAEAGGDTAMLGWLAEIRSELPGYRTEPAFRSVYRRAARYVGRGRRGLQAVGWYLRVIDR